MNILFSLFCNANFVSPNIQSHFASLRDELIKTEAVTDVVESSTDFPF